jgi:hypothetical protein
LSSPFQNILSDGALAYYYAQKAIRHVAMRRLLGAAVARYVGWRSRPLPPPAPGSVAARAAADLQRTGFAALPEKSLSTESLRQAREQLESCMLNDYYDSTRKYRLDAVPTDVVKLRYSNEDVAACRILTDLANDPDILAAVTQRLGAAPTIATAEAWWTFGEHNQAGKSAFDDIYHRDVDDFRFVKVFLYLTDTGLSSGAHRFVLGSHADERFVRRGPIRDHEVESVYAADQLKTVTGTAGTVFLEDTWGIHRALLATTGRRLVFSAMYVLASHVPFGPRHPRLPLPQGYNRYTNRLLFC